MKRQFSLLILLILTASVAACTATMPEATPQATIIEDAPTEAENESDPTAEPTETQRGGFVASSGAIADLPGLRLQRIADTTACISSVTEPAITLEPVVYDTSLLCLFNFAVGEGAAPIVVTLTDPEGITYNETFEFFETDNGFTELLGTTLGVKAQFRGGVGSAPMVTFVMRFDATLPTGEWTVVADNGLVRAEEVIVVERLEPLSAAIPDGYQGNPFTYEETSEFVTGDEVTLVGTGYQAESELDLALYALEFNSTLLPYYSTVVQTDAEGDWQAAFEVGSDTPSLQYQVVVNPRELSRPVNAFGTTFNVAR